ncbi:MAG: hypothetical protein ACJAXS_001651 [Colwellia sp.]|jgi:hypothetical protein
MAGENKTISTLQEKYTVKQIATKATHQSFFDLVPYCSSAKQRAEESKLHLSKHINKLVLS